MIPCKDCDINHDITKESCEHAKERVNALLAIHELNKSGWAGILSNGNIVDRRIHREALAIQENPLFNVPKPNKLPKLDEVAYKQTLNRVDELISITRNEEEQKELDSLSIDIIEYEQVYYPIQEPELYTKQDLEDAFYAGFSESGEGWNAEYLGDEGTIDGNMDIITKRLKDNCNSYIKDVKSITM